ncbi:MAG: HlyD family efflux transporter periplasmic adaptor subunit [bacterium]
MESEENRGSEFGQSGLAKAAPDERQIAQSGLTKAAPDDRQIDQSNLLKVTPNDSPSENYLVTEHLQKMPSLFARGLVYVIVLMLAVALVYSLVSKIDIVVEALSLARPVSHKIRVVSDRTGYIVDIGISEGQNIQKGAPLFFILSKEAISYRSRIDELHHTIPLKEEYYRNSISSAQDELDRLRRELPNTLTVKRLKLEQNRLSLHALEVDLAFWQEEVTNLKKEFENTRKLFEKQLTSIAEYNNIKSRFERAGTEVNKIISQKDITEKEYRIMQQEFENTQSGYESKIASLEKEIENLELEKKSAIQSLHSELEMKEKMLSLHGDASYGDTPRGNPSRRNASRGNASHGEKQRRDISHENAGFSANTPFDTNISIVTNTLFGIDIPFGIDTPVQPSDEKDKGTIIRADRAGIISELYFRNKGEYVRESDLLCTILPLDSPLHMDIMVANKDIGFIEVDMEIKYKFDAFPYADYGTLSGKVLSISPSAVEDKNQGFIYHIRGSLQRPYYEIKGKKYFLKPGMTATAELVTEKKSIFSILFRKVKMR